MSITVLLPVRNGEVHISEAIESVLAQSVSGLQLLVSNNFSTDGTVEIVSGYRSDPRVRFVNQDESTDAVGHFNKCMALLDTKYFMLLCHDDFLCHRQSLAQAHEALEKNPDVVAVFCDVAYVDKTGGLLHVRKFGRQGIVEGAAIARSSVKSIRNLFGIPLLIRTGAVEGIRYDSRLRYAADLDFAIAMSKRGPVFHIPEPMIANRYHGRNATTSLFRLAFEQMLLIARKNDVAIGRGDRIAMLLNSWLVAFQKWLFFQYLGKIRSGRSRERYTATQSNDA